MFTRETLSKRAASEEKYILEKSEDPVIEAWFKVDANTVEEVAQEEN